MDDGHGPYGSGEALLVSSRLLPGVFVGSHAIAQGLLTREQLRERSYRRLTQGVYADPARAGAIDGAALMAMAEKGAGQWGAVKVRRAVSLVDPRAESAPESRVRVALVLAGLAPVPQYDVIAEGVLIGRVDFAWPEARLAVEYEGAHHFEDLQIVRDDARLEKLIAAGWRVIRLSATDLRNLDAVVARVREALNHPQGHNGHEGP